MSIAKGLLQTLCDEDVGADIKTAFKNSAEGKRVAAINEEIDALNKAKDNWSSKMAKR
jgi:hypothetical protein